MFPEFDIPEFNIPGFDIYVASCAFSAAMLQSRMVLSVLPLTRISCETNAIAAMPPVCPRRISRHCPVSTSHNRIVSSSLLLARTDPSGLKATDRTRLVCPCKTCRQVWVWISQRRIVASSLPLASRWLSGLNCTECTQLVCPWNTCSKRASEAFHTQTSPSTSAVANCWPSLLKATANTALSGLVKVECCK